MKTSHEEIGQTAYLHVQKIINNTHNYWLRDLMRSLVHLDTQG